MNDRIIAQWIVDHEARRDSNGRIKVYYLPSGDGGGRFEIAGINERYHPVKANRLYMLIQQGKHKQAEEEAVEYIRQWTKDAADWTDVLSIQAFLRDTIFNRGVRGAGTVLQLALNSLGHDLEVDGRVGPLTLAALREEEKNEEALLHALRQAREKYERTKYPWKPNARNESSKFWKGLVNRWNAITEFSHSLIGEDRIQLTEKKKVKKETTQNDLVRVRPERVRKTPDPPKRQTRKRDSKPVV